MPWHFEIEEGPTSSRTFELKPGVNVTVGRVSGVTEVCEDDPSMAPVHFAVSLAGGLVRLQNLCQATGTEVNGQRTEAAVLKSGDRVKAGRTTFVVRAPATSPYPARLRIGGWGFEFIPEGWQVIECVGFHLAVDNEKRFRATITAVEEPLPVAQTLSSYVEKQITLARGQITGISFDGPVPVVLRGSDEALSLAITVPLQNEWPVMQRQVYAHSPGIVGVFTATVSESEPHGDTLNTVIEGLSYFQG